LLFRIVWLDNDCAEVGEDIMLKDNMGAAIRAAASRIKMSPHLVPKETYGFFVNWANEKEREVWENGDPLGSR